jgi:hypothetical protein
MPLCESPKCIEDATTERRRVKLCQPHARWVDVHFPSDGALTAEFEATVARLQRELESCYPMPPPSAAIDDGELDAIDDELAKLALAGGES